MEDTNSLIEQRKAKLASLRAKGIDPFQNKFTPSETCTAARSNYTEGRAVAVAGRITAHRDMGKSMFIDVKDQSGRIQAYAQKNVLGNQSRVCSSVPSEKRTQPASWFMPERSRTYTPSSCRRLTTQGAWSNCTKK